MHLVTFNKTYNWAYSFEPDKILGYSNETCDCPLWQFMIDTYNVEDVRIVPKYNGNDTYDRAYVYYKRPNSSKEYRQELPKWAVRLLWDIDHGDFWQVYEEDSIPITADDFLTLLFNAYNGKD